MSSIALAGLFLGDVDTAEAILSDLETQQLDEWIAADVKRQRGIIESARGNHRAALACYKESRRRCATKRNQTEIVRFLAYKHLDLGDLNRAELLGSHLHGRHVEFGVPTYIEKTTNLLGLIAVRAGRVEEGMRRIADALDSAYARADRYQAWRYLHSATESLLALGRATEASAILRFADEVADDSGYWLPAIEWTPLIDRSALGPMSAGTDAAPIGGFEQAIEIVRSAPGMARFSD
jgi:tetratricopeptide (TPR) repeat protein